MNNKIFGILILAVSILACSKSTSYYKDSGNISTTYSGNSLDYLKSHKYHQFDSLVKIIHLAGLDDVIANGKYTFFAPPDSIIKLSVNEVNKQLKSIGNDTISRLEQISSVTWRNALSMYIFDSVRLVNDYPQLELNSLSASLSFPGKSYLSFEGTRIMNIGAIYESASGVQYAGYRHLVLSYIPSLSAPLINLISNFVATSNIVTSNGVIHALTYTVFVHSGSNNPATYYQSSTPYFAFDPDLFYQNVVRDGITF